MDADSTATKRGAAMKQFEVTITETYVKKIIVEAETAQQAEDKVIAMSMADEIDWSCDCDVEGDIEVKEVQP